MPLIDLSNKCVLVALFISIWYNRKDLIEKYKIFTVYDFIDLLLYGNNEYKSLCDKLSDKTQEIDAVWKNTFENIDLPETNKQKLVFEYANGINMLQKINEKILNGSISFELLLYVGMYFNVHFKEILIYKNDNENYILNTWNDIFITNPDSEIILQEAL